MPIYNLIIVMVNAQPSLTLLSLKKQYYISPSATFVTGKREIFLCVRVKTSEKITVTYEIMQ